MKKDNTAALTALRDALESPVFKKLLERQESFEKEFNIFKALRICDHEIRHSNMLAWLMDPQETHGLGSRFLTKLLSEIQTANEDRDYGCLSLHEDDYDFKDCNVLREDDNIDIKVEFPHAKVVLVSENKWNAGESEGVAYDDGQLKKYKKAIDSQFKDWEKVFIFLTPDMRLPSEKNQEEWGILGYAAIRQCLIQLLGKESFAANPTVKDFIVQYKQIIEERIGYMRPEEAKLCEEIYAKFHEVWKLVEDQHAKVFTERLLGKLAAGFEFGNPPRTLGCQTRRIGGTYLQYGRRLPEGSYRSVHYEIENIDMQKLSCDVVLHIETETDSSVRDRLLSEIREKTSGIQGITWIGNGVSAGKVGLAGKTADEAYEEIRQRMELLYNHCEPIIAMFENQPGSQK